jgi:ankyrin repeat protein
VRANDVEISRALVEAGAKAGAANRYGVTPLSLAAVNADAAMIEMLLAAGADANSGLPSGETPLMTAARTGKADAVKVLLAHGADVNAVERELGETALMWAAAHDQADVIRLLVSHGATLNARSKALEFPKITFNGSTMVSSLMPRGGLTSLMFAARQDALESARALVESGADLNATDPDGTSALVMAILNLHYDVAGLLADKGADPNVADASGMTALYAVEEMRTSGRLINRPSRKATGSVDTLDLMKTLLAHGAHLNSRLKTPTIQRYHNAGDNQLAAGATPLMRAAKSLDLPAVRVLLEGGADPNLMTRNFTTAMVFAAGAGRGRAGEADTIEAMQLCLKRGADVNAFNTNGQTALHVAAGRGTDTVVKFLVEHGAELDIKDKDGRTPLDIAMGVASSAFQGPRGAGPTQVHESTAALLRQFVGASISSARP